MIKLGLLKRERAIIPEWSKYMKVGGPGLFVKQDGSSKTVLRVVSFVEGGLEKIMKTILEKDTIIIPGGDEPEDKEDMNVEEYEGEVEEDIDRLIIDMDEEIEEEERDAGRDDPLDPPPQLPGLPPVPPLDYNPGAEPP